MKWLHRVRKAVADLLGRNRFEREMDEELQTFLDLSARDQERAGRPAADARRTASASFGGIEGCKDTLRDLRAGAALDSFGRDVRFSIRLLRRSPSFAAAAIFTIALGTFPLAATMGFANSVFFLPAPGVTGGDRLVTVEFTTRDEDGDRDSAKLSYVNHAELMHGLKSLTGLAGRASGTASIAAAGVEAQHVDIDYVMHDYFQVLGMRMAAGRSFLPSEDLEPGGTPVVILSHTLATTLFGTPERGPGRSVLINGLDFTVVGVAARGFRGLKNDHYSQLWLPGATYSFAGHTPRERWVGGRSGGLFEQFVGRLAADAGVEQARTELTVAIRAIAAAYPAENRQLRTSEVQIDRQPGMSFSGGNVRDRVASMVLMFTSAATLLLLLAAANVGNLLLFRVSRRRDEMALRTALGASRWRLLRAHLIEVAMLSVLGGAGGLAITIAFGRLLDGFVVVNAGFLNLPIDWRAGGLVVAAAVLVGLAFGGAPMLFGSAAGFAPGVRRATGSGGRRLRNGLTVMQLAISLSLIVGATLLLATIRNLAGVDIGFDPSKVASAQIYPRRNGYDDARALELYRTLLERAAAMPAVGLVSVSGWEPVGTGALRIQVQRAGDDRGQPLSVATNGISAEYFRVLGLPLLRGRAFSRDESLTLPDGSCGPVVLSESLAMRLFDTRDALDRIVVLPRRVPLECRVVGVVADVRSTGPEAEVTPVLYRPLGRSDLFRATVLARSTGTVEAASAALREAAASIDPAMPLYGRKSLVETLEFQLAGRRIISAVLGALAVMGLLMAAVGLYGLIAETVVDRTREFAIRMAIGADGRRIVLTVLRRAILLAVIGTAIGIALSAGLAGAIRSQLFGVRPLEPWVYLSAAGILALVVVIASLAPAMRAAQTNPVNVLRAE